jgi:hypothetical protein
MPDERQEHIVYDILRRSLIVEQTQSQQQQIRLVLLVNPRQSLTAPPLASKHKQFVFHRPAHRVPTNVRSTI